MAKKPKSAEAREPRKGRSPARVEVPTSETAPETALRVPAHGHGMLLAGGQPGNRGGGRPPSEVRAACRESFYARIPRLESIADAEGSTDEQRISAIDKLGKYGLSGGVSADDVRERLKLTLNEIRTFPGLAADQAALLVDRIKQHWVSA